MRRLRSRGQRGWCDGEAVIMRKPNNYIADKHENNTGSFSAERMILAGHPSGYFAPGSMDDFCIYSLAFRKDEIHELYNL